jgi:4-hydroxythreonine-4-phosphate dehydrogenase
MRKLAKGGEMKQLVAIADDLSGAAETAVHFFSEIAHDTQSGALHSFSPPRIHLVPVVAQAAPRGVGRYCTGGSNTIVFDADNRRLSPDDSSRRLAALLDELHEDANGDIAIFLKVDSLLRGHLADSLKVLSRFGPVVLTPALPALGRFTRDGVVYSQGVPLHDTSLWSAEQTQAPQSIRDALEPLKSGLIDLATVRGTLARLIEALRVLSEQNLIAVCDAESNADLDAIAAAATQMGAHIAGSSALGAAVGRLTRHTPALPPGLHTLNSQLKSIPILLVLGTASEQGRDQLTALSDSGVTVIPLKASSVLAGTIDPTSIGVSLTMGPVAVHLETDPDERVESEPLGQAFAQLIAPLVSQHCLFLSGGATARAVLDAAGVKWLEPVTEIEHGAVLCRTDLNTLVVTRPGSFGSPDSLVMITNFLQAFLYSSSADTGPSSEMEIS